MARHAKRIDAPAIEPEAPAVIPRVQGRDDLVPIVDGRAAIRGAGLRVSLHRPDGELLEYAATEEDAIARAEVLIAKGAL